MKKDGFVFVESIVVLVVVALSLAMLLSSYSLVARKTKEKEFYDRASDKYLLYALSTLGTDDLCNYSSASTCNGRSFGVNLAVSKDTCNSNSKKTSQILYNCEKLFDDLDIEYLYVVDDIKSELSKSTAVKTYDNGAIEYMKSLKKCNDDNVAYSGQTTETGETRYANGRESSSCSKPIKYMIGVFKRSEKDYYYASIELGD